MNYVVLFVISLVAVSKGMRAVKTLHHQNPQVLNWRCRLTHVAVYNGRKTVIVGG